MRDFSLLIFLSEGYIYEPEVCNSCHDVSLLAYELENIAQLNIKGVGYKMRFIKYEWK